MSVPSSLFRIPNDLIGAINLGWIVLTIQASVYIIFLLGGAVFQQFLDANMSLHGLKYSLNPPLNFTHLVSQPFWPDGRQKWTLPPPPMFRKPSGTRGGWSSWNSTDVKLFDFHIAWVFFARLAKTLGQSFCQGAQAAKMSFKGRKNHLSLTPIYARN